MNVKFSLTVLRLTVFALYSVMVGSSGAGAQTVTVIVMPDSSPLRAGSSSRFYAAVLGNANQAVTWSANGINGGNTIVGTITNNGDYQAPAVLPASNIITIRATSVAVSSASGTATLTLLNPATSVTTVEPSQINANSAFSFKILGTGFANGAIASLGDQQLVTTFVSSSELRASGTTSLAGAVALTVANPEPGSTIAGVPVTVLPAVRVVVTPSISVRTGQTQQLDVIVEHTSDKSVNWAVNGVAGGNNTVGTISAGGLYAAPVVAPSPNTVTVKATSVADPTASATCTTTLLNRVVSVTRVEPAQFNVNVPLSFRIFGQDFVDGAKVTLGGNQLVTTFVSSTELAASGTASATGGFPLLVTNPEPGSTVAGAAVTIIPAVTVSLTPAAGLRGGAIEQLTSNVEQTTDKRVTWTVNGIVGGNATLGTVSAGGLYTAPDVAPSPNTVLVKASSVADPTASATCTVMLFNPIPVVTSVTPNPISPGAFSITVDGSGFAPGASIRFGTQVLGTTWVSVTRLQATGTAAATIGGRMALSIINPEPGAAVSNVRIVRVGPANPVVSAQAAARFLGQASWGPDPESIARVQEIGFGPYLDEQFDAPMSEYPDPPLSDGQQSPLPALMRFFLNAMTGRDQLRQRVAFALSQIFVVSAGKAGQARELVPYLRMLRNNAFGAYFTLVGEVTLHPTMGHFLDLKQPQGESANGVAAQ